MQPGKLFDIPQWRNADGRVDRFHVSMLRCSLCFIELSEQFDPCRPEVVGSAITSRQAVSRFRQPCSHLEEVEPIFNQLTAVFQPR